MSRLNTSGLAAALAVVCIGLVVALSAVVTQRNDALLEAAQARQESLQNALDAGNAREEAARAHANEAWAILQMKEVREALAKATAPAEPSAAVSARQGR